MKTEFGKFLKRIMIIALHKCGVSLSEIVILLKPLGINRLFVFHPVKRHNEKDDMREGHLHSVHLPNVILLFVNM